MPNALTRTEKIELLNEIDLSGFNILNNSGYNVEPPKLEYKVDEPPPPPEIEELQIVSASDLQKKELSPVKVVVDGLILHGLTLLCSPPKYGKSFLVMLLCLAVSSGVQFLGRNTNTCGCLYLALEDSLNRLKSRMDIILLGRKAPDNFFYAINSLDLSNNLIEQLEKFVKQHPDVKLIIVDTLQKVRGTAGRSETIYANDYKEIGLLKKFADSHDLAVVVVHHLRKGADDSDPFNRISGTNGIAGAADTSIVLTRKNRADKKTILNIVGRDVQQDELLLEFDNQTFQWRMIGNADEEVERIEKEAYNNNPIVVTIRKLLEANPTGWQGSASELWEASI